MPTPAWCNPPEYPGSPVIGSSGTVSPFDYSSLLYAGLNGYTSETVTWDGVWTPAAGGSAPPYSGGSFTYPDALEIANYLGTFPDGTYVFTCTVDGVPHPTKLEVTFDGGDAIYGVYAPTSIPVVITDDLTGTGELTGSAVQSSTVALGLWENYGHERSVDGVLFPSFGGASNYAISTGPCPSDPQRMALEISMAAATSVYVQASLSVNDASESSGIGVSMVSTDTGVEYRYSGATTDLLFKDTTVYSDGVQVLRKIDVNIVNSEFRCFAGGVEIASGSFISDTTLASLGSIRVQIGTDRYGGPDPTVARHHLLRATINEGDEPTPTAPFWQIFRNSREITG